MSETTVFDRPRLAFVAALVMSAILHYAILSGLSLPRRPQVLPPSLSVTLIKLLPQPEKQTVVEPPPKRAAIVSKPAAARPRTPVQATAPDETPTQNATSIPVEAVMIEDPVVAEPVPPLIQLPFPVTIETEPVVVPRSEDVAAQAGDPAPVPPSASEMLTRGIDAIRSGAIGGEAETPAFRRSENALPAGLFEGASQLVDESEMFRDIYGDVRFTRRLPNGKSVCFVLREFLSVGDQPVMMWMHTRC